MFAGSDEVASHLNQWRNKEATQIFRELLRETCSLHQISYDKVQTLQTHMNPGQMEHFYDSIESTRRTFPKVNSHAMNQMDMCQMQYWIETWIDGTLKIGEYCLSDLTVRDTILELQGTFLEDLDSWLESRKGAQSVFLSFVQIMRLWVKDSQTLYKSHKMLNNTPSRQDSKSNKKLQNTLVKWISHTVEMMSLYTGSEEQESWFSEFCCKHGETVEMLVGQMTSQRQETIRPFIDAHLNVVRHLETLYRHSTSSVSPTVKPVPWLLDLKKTSQSDGAVLAF